MLLNSRAFIQTEQLYEIRLEVVKEGRMASTHLQIQLTLGRPPIMQIV